MDVIVNHHSLSVRGVDVAEGCATSTTGNDLLRFNATIVNQGTADISLGNPG